MVGLSTAWFLQQDGVQVTVLEREHVAAGASWGNAGWVAPALTMPLNDPSILATGIRAAMSRSSPVYVPPTMNPRLLSFLLRFSANCTRRRFSRALRLFIDVNRAAIRAYELLLAGGVDGTLRPSDPFIAAFSSGADRKVLLDEFEDVVRSGGEVRYESISGDNARLIEPLLGAAVESAVLLHGQRFINPIDFVASLAAAVRDRGGRIRESCPVARVSSTGRSAIAHVEDGDDVTADAIVLANGTWLGGLARPFGVRTIVQAGRGYSFRVGTATPARNPIYFPAQRVACTPIDGMLRIAGMMEFKRPDAPLDPRRIEVIVETARPLLNGIDWATRSDEWVGSRPCTPDGLPLIGRTRAANVFVAGGHGMWGIALGPLTGQILARQVAKGERSPLLANFDPLR